MFTHNPPQSTSTCPAGAPWFKLKKIRTKFMQVKSLVTLLCLIKIHWWELGCNMTLMTNHSGGKTTDIVQVNCVICASKNTVFLCGGTPHFLKHGPPSIWEAALQMQNYRTTGDVFLLIGSVIIPLWQLQWSLPEGSHMLRVFCVLLTSLNVI